MVLTAKQKERLAPYGRARNAEGGINCIVTIKAPRKYPRELGGKWGYQIRVDLLYLIDGEYDFPTWVSFCTTEHTAIDKGKEISRYLAEDLEIGRQNVKLQKERG